MKKAIKMNTFSAKSVAEVFEDFVLSQTAKNLSETTIRTYHAHIHSISKHLDIQKPMDKLTKKDLAAMVMSMRRAGLAHNSISSYCRVFRTFLKYSLGFQYSCNTTMAHTAIDNRFGFCHNEKNGRGTAYA